MIGVLFIAGLAVGAAFTAYLVGWGVLSASVPEPVWLDRIGGVPVSQGTADMTDALHQATLDRADFVLAGGTR
jgi:hypothetical protein